MNSLTKTVIAAFCLVGAANAEDSYYYSATGDATKEKVAEDAISLGMSYYDYS